MLCTNSIQKSLRFSHLIMIRGASSTTSRDKEIPISHKKPVTNLSQLANILSDMKVTNKFERRIKEFGNSDTFSYATNKEYSKDELKEQSLKVWGNLHKDKVDQSGIRIPLNGFDELIQLTEEGKMWKYPIDNEQGLEAEQRVPFEEHVFLDHYLEKFPKNEEIQNVMQLIISGLGKNNWLTVERKQEILQFYLDYFKEKRETYKQAGYEI